MKTIKTIYESYVKDQSFDLVTAIRDLPGAYYVPLTGEEEFFSFVDDSGTINIYYKNGVIPHFHLNE